MQLSKNQPPTAPAWGRGGTRPATCLGDRRGHRLSSPGRSRTCTHMAPDLESGVASNYTTGPFSLALERQGNVGVWRWSAERKNLNWKRKIPADQRLISCD